MVHGWYPCMLVLVVVLKGVIIISYATGGNLSFRLGLRKVRFEFGSSLTCSVPLLSLDWNDEVYPCYKGPPGIEHVLGHGVPDMG
ncbi:hypothetical protein BDR22DRAFT_834858 [Usnea florida]